MRFFQEKRLQQAVQDAQEKARLQLLTEMEEFRQEAALEISLQRHSYEDEIASLNRVLQERQCSEALSPPLPFPTMGSTNWDEVEAIIQDTERELALPKKNSDVINYSYS